MVADQSAGIAVNSLFRQLATCDQAAMITALLKPGETAGNGFGSTGPLEEDCR
jgi:hypothetical protein